MRAVQPALESHKPGRRLGSALILGAVTGLSVTVPAWLMFSWVGPMLGLGAMNVFLTVGLGIVTFVAALLVPAALWGVVVGVVAGVKRAPVARRSLKVGLLTVLPVAIGVDLSQLFIGLVAPRHRLAVHVLFAIAFTAGMAVFLGVVSSKLSPLVASLRADGQLSVDGISRQVAVATAFATAAGGVLAVPLDWVVVPGMGMAMLEPLYLVLGTGTTAGGAVLGWRLGARD